MLTPSELLADDGPLAKSIDDFISRPLQQELADTIYTAIQNQESFVCEAGTGTGKTFAYLVPALLSGKKVLISTGTKHLQDQIYYRDLPTVYKALKSTTSNALLKGRANYLCKLRHKLADDIIKSPVLYEELKEVNHWSYRTETGDLTDVLPESAGIRPWVSSTVDNCLGQDCEHYDKCYVLKARKRANQADIIIVNHHLLLADMSLRETGFGELLPNVDVIIFDEAHQLPELASQFFSRSFTSRQCLDLAADTRTAYEEEAWDIDDFEDITYELEKNIRNFRAQFVFNEQKIEWQTVISDNKIKTNIQTLSSSLQILADAIDKIAERGKQLENCFKRALQSIEKLDSFLNESEQEYVQWLEVRGKGLLLHQTPLNIADEFQSRLEHYNSIGIYTSATLAVNENFKHFNNQLGLNDVQSKTWPSPFDYQKQTLLYSPKEMPNPSESNFTAKVIERSLPVLEASQGRAFLLFTSHRALKEASELLANKINYPIYIQGDKAKTELLDEFRQSQNGILLGTSSFWEGVDVKGSTLSCVIIDKLPFAMPDDPILKARGAKMKDMGKNVFIEYQVPQAIIALKQGVGRLIRDANDQGVLMICDPRLRTKSYGKIFLKSLPNMKRTIEISEVVEFYKMINKG